MLSRMRQLYVLLSNEKVAPLVQHLSWSQCLLLIPMKDLNKIAYYANQVVIRNLSKRELNDIIKNEEYERLDEKTKLKLINEEPQKIYDFVKNPILIKNKNNDEINSEKSIKKINS